MRTSFGEYMDALRARLLDASGRLPVSVRTDILEGRIAPGLLNAFVVRVRASATTVTPEHIAELRASGLDEDQIFEATVCAAVRAGIERYQAAMNALSEHRDAS